RLDFDTLKVIVHLRGNNLGIVRLVDGKKQKKTKKNRGPPHFPPLGVPVRAHRTSLTSLPQPRLPPRLYLKPATSAPLPPPPAPAPPPKRPDSCSQRWHHPR